MNWGTIQESYFFLFLFLTVLSIGGFVVGILLGSIWMRLCSMERVVPKQQKSLSSKIYARVFSQPRRENPGEAKCRVSTAQKSTASQSFCLHSV